MQLQKLDEESIKVESEKEFKKIPKKHRKFSDIHKLRIGKSLKEFYKTEKGKQRIVETKQRLYKEKIGIKCLICGKIFYLLPYNVKNRKYCSRECFYKTLPGTKVGNDNPSKRPEVRKKISDSLKLGFENGRVSWIKGLTKETDKRVAKLRQNFEEKFSLEQRQEWLNKAWKNRKYKNTSIEIKMEKSLKKHGIETNPQVIIPNVCIIDFVPKNTKIAVFCDGDYWHNYPYGTEIDKRVTEKLTKIGWKVLRFWEKDIKGNIKYCVSKIMEVL